MNQHQTENNNPNHETNQTNRESAKLITLTAFLIGYLLIDNLNSNEQNALGNFFMLIGQTLCTCGSENFKQDWSSYSNPTNTPSNGNNNNGFSKPSPMTREQTIDMFNRAKNIFNQEIDKLQ